MPRITKVHLGLPDDEQVMCGIPRTEKTSINPASVDCAGCLMAFNSDMQRYRNELLDMIERRGGPPI